MKTILLTLVFLIFSATSSSAASGEGHACGESLETIQKHQKRLSNVYLVGTLNGELAEEFISLYNDFPPETSHFARSVRVFGRPGRPNYCMLFFRTETVCVTWGCMPRGLVEPYLIRNGS